ncbi:MAG: phosphoglycerate kinase [Verrucomicrobia bacterium]|nr:MAG: phosphoglycerate kinase [Verrucomicrobiota bacterium]
MQEISSIKNLHLSNLRVLVRVDFNVPLDSKGNVTDITRLLGVVPTVKYLLEHNAKIILISHLGRPNGKKDSSLSLEPVAKSFSQIIGQEVHFIPDCIGSRVQRAITTMNPGEIILLENLRFYPQEETNDMEFAEQIASLADVYINDAFGTAHRAHASTVAVPELMRVRAAGFLMLKEIEFLGKKTMKPERPFVVILGGAKVSDKINVINTLLNKADVMLIGGAMAYTFALAKGLKVGKSLVEPDKVEVAKECLKKAEEKKVKFLLPIDTLITDHLDFKAGKVGQLKVVEGDIPEGWEGIDIGPKTIDLFAKEIVLGKTILWNGPMGIFEIKDSAKGTNEIAKAVSEFKGISIVGGGDSIKAINESGYANKISFISTGGGATLEFLEGIELPGLKVLEKPTEIEN